MRWVWLMLCLWLAGPAQAETVAVKTGEHEGFTRLVLQLEQPTPWSMGRTPDGYELRLGRDGIIFDLTEVFAAIPRNRLAAVWEDPASGALRFGIGCACHAMPFEFRPDVIVIDLRDGPPPRGSAFEAALDGVDVPDLAKRAQIKPRPRPADVDAHNWTQTALDVMLPRESSLPPRLILPDPAVVDMRETLLRQIGHGAAQGVLDVAPILRGAPRDRPAPTLNPSGAALHLEIGPNPGPSPGLTARTADAPGPSLTAMGQTCLPDSALSISDWADARPFAEQIADARADLLGEFDRPDPDSVADYVKLYLHFGFGAEVRSILGALPTDTPERPLWESLARILDGEDLAAGNPLAGQEGCDGAAAMWAVLALPAPGTANQADAKAVLRSFSALPPHLRRHLGPGLADRFLDAGDPGTARGLRDAILRAPGDPGPGTRMLDAGLDVEAGKLDSAEAGLVGVAETAGTLAPLAVIELVDLRLGQDIAIDPGMVTAIAALAREHRGTPLGARLKRAEGLARASAGDFAAGFALTEAGNAAMTSDLWSLLARIGPDEALLAHAVVRVADLPAEADTQSRRLIAERLIGLGFADEAQSWLASAASEDGRLAARAEVMRRDARAALRVLGGESGPDADLLRAAALTQLGDAAAAAAAYSAAGAEAQARRALWWSRDWPRIAIEGDEVQRAAATALAPQEQSAANVAGPPSPPLARGRALVEASTAIRAAATALLSAVPGPDAEGS